jgi:hypothetical protein
MGGRLKAETQRRLQAPGKALTGETIDHADINAWAASFSTPSLSLIALKLHSVPLKRSSRLQYPSFCVSNNYLSNKK